MSCLISDVVHTDETSVEKKGLLVLKCYDSSLNILEKLNWFVSLGQSCHLKYIYRKRQLLPPSGFWTSRALSSGLRR